MAEKNNSQLNNTIDNGKLKMENEENNSQFFILNSQLNMPQLRFPEFEEEWLEKLFNEICERSNEKYNPEKNNDSYKCIELESIEQNTGKILNTFDSISLKSIKNRFHNGEVLYGKLRPYLKKYFLSDFEGVCSSEIWVLKGKVVSNSYLYYLIQLEKFNYQINLTIGSKMPRADWTIIGNSKFFIPKPPSEQTKIATFLTAVDKRISLLQKKKIQLEHYKKGVMQQLFVSNYDVNDEYENYDAKKSKSIKANQKNHSSRQLRFKKDDGSDFPDWEEKKLGEVFRTISTKPHQIKNKDILNEGKYKVIDQGQGQIAGYSNDETKLLKNKKVIVYGDHTTIVKYIDFDFIIGADGTKVLEAKSNDNIVYLFYCLLHNNIKPEGYKRHFSILKTIILPIPHKEEQQKIANFLSSIDKSIENLNNQIEQSQVWKKGLLQKMFV